MKINEILLENREVVDVLDLQQEEFRQYLRENPSLFESSDQFKNLQGFLRIHDSVKPMVGMFYTPISILSTPIVKYISVKQVNDVVELESDQNNSLTFITKTKKQKFPLGENEGEDKLQHTLLFSSVNDKDQFLTLLRMKFGDWKIVVGDL